MKQVFFTLIFYAFFLNSSSAQQFPGWCHTHSKWDEMATAHPEYYGMRDSYKESVKSEINRSRTDKSGEDVLVIPIVFHIIHDNGLGNISEAQVQNAIDYCNDHFRKNRDDTNNIVLPFRNFHKDTRIEFRRARIDPDGKCSLGITRTSSSLTNSGDDNVKDLVRWDNHKYLNVWVVRSIASGAGGYSYTPPVSDDIDGIVLLAGYLGALPHEAGHWLGLNHTWGPSNDANASGNCTLDDDIDDTPKTMGNNFCSTSRNSCGDNTYVDPEGNTLWTGDVQDNTQNIMDYGNCAAENFTAGQKDFMRGTLNSTFNGRNNLWTPENRLATGTNDGFVVHICPPRAEFSESSKIICQNTNILFEDESTGEPVHSYKWEFEGGTPATSTSSSPIVNYINPGNFKVTLIVTNNTYGSDTTVKEQHIEVISTQQSESAPAAQGFEDHNFLTNPDQKWTASSTYSSAWAHVNTASHSGNYSLRIKNSSIPNATVSTLISPYLDLSDIDNCNKLTFRYAYAPKKSQNNDELKVYISDDCGQSWDLVEYRSGIAMSTSPVFVASSFEPAADEWEEVEVGLSAYTGRTHVLIKFEEKSDLGNNFYLDHINIGCAPDNLFLNTPELEATNVALFPNPAQGNINLILKGVDVQSLQLDIYNVMGQNVFSRQVSPTNSTMLTIPSKEIGESGVYFLTLSNNNTTINKKFILK